MTAVLSPLLFRLGLYQVSAVPGETPGIATLLTWASLNQPSVWAVVREGRRSSRASGQALCSLTVRQNQHWPGKEGWLLEEHP